MSLLNKLAGMSVLICLSTTQVFGQTNEMPMMVHSDAKRFGNEKNIEGCGLMITANSINGEYISVVLRLHDNKQGQAVVEHTISSGNIDYTNGNETYDYVEDAWLESGDFTTEDNVVDIRRGPNDYAYRATYRKHALGLYEAIVHNPFELTLITTMHNQPYTKTFEQPFDQVVAKKAEDCLNRFKAQR